MSAVAERTYVMMPCPNCDGKGERRGPALYPGTGAYRPLVRCTNCDGTGKVRKYPPRKPPKEAPKPDYTNVAVALPYLRERIAGFERFAEAVGGELKDEWIAVKALVTYLDAERERER